MVHSAFSHFMNIYTWISVYNVLSLCFDVCFENLKNAEHIKEYQRILHTANTWDIDDDYVEMTDILNKYLTIT